MRERRQRQFFYAQAAFNKEAHLSCVGKQFQGLKPIHVWRRRPAMVYAWTMWSNGIDAQETLHGAKTFSFTSPLKSFERFHGFNRENRRGGA